MEAHDRQQDRTRDENDLQNRLRDNVRPMVAADVGPEGDDTEDVEADGGFIIGPFPINQGADDEKRSFEE